jgi:CBS domain-containing protein
MNAVLAETLTERTPDDLAQALAKDLANERAADIVDALNQLTPEIAARILLHLPLELAIETLDTPGLDAAEIIAAFPRDKVMPYISGMSDDRVAEILRHLPRDVRNDLITRLDAPARAALDRILSYPPDTAGAIMTTEFVTVPADWSVKQTLAHIRMVEKSRETIYSIFVVDPVTKKFIKAVTLRRLISAEPNDLVTAAAPDRPPVTVAPNAGRDEAARLISKYDLLAVPVVENGMVIGIVTVDDIIDELIQSQTDEVQRLGGSEALGAPYMDISFLGDDQETRRLAVRAVPVGNADGHRHAGFRKRAGKGSGADPVHSADHVVGRQFGFAGDLADHPRPVLAGNRPARLVAGGLARAAERSAAGRHTGGDRRRADHRLAAARLVQLRPALDSGGNDGRHSANRHRDFWLDVGVNAAVRLAKTGL